MFVHRAGNMTLKKIFAVLFLLSGCTTAAVEGKDINVVEAGTPYLANCKMLGPVQIEISSWALKPHDDVKSKLSDEAAIKYPDADTMAYAEIRYGGGYEKKFSGVAFDCFE